MGTKQWHDLVKPGTWNLIVLVPIIGPIWWIASVGFTRGQWDDSEHGPGEGSKAMPVPGKPRR